MRPITAAGAALNGPSGNRLRFEQPRKRPFPLGVRSVYALNLPTRLPEDPVFLPWPLTCFTTAAIGHQPPLACAHNATHFFLQRRNVRLQYAPDNIEVDAEVVVDQAVSHSGLGAPLHRRICVAHLGRQSLRRLADDLKTPDNGALKDGVLLQRLARQRRPHLNEEVRLGEDVRAQGGREALGRDELDMASQHGLEQIPKIDKVRERLLLGLKLDEQVNITVR